MRHRTAREQEAGGGAERRARGTLHEPIAGRRQADDGVPVAGGDRGGPLRRVGVRAEVGTHPATHRHDGIGLTSQIGEVAPLFGQGRAPTQVLHPVELADHDGHRLDLVEHRDGALDLVFADEIVRRG